MKIIFVSSWYSEGMGYLENALPKALAKLGHEVHLITSTAQVYYNQSYWRDAYSAYLGEPIVEEQTYNSNGVTIHRLPFKTIRKRISIIGLTTLIRSIQPDIVHTFMHSDWDTLRIVLTKNTMTKSFKLFTANHTSYLALFPTPQSHIDFNWKRRTLFFLSFTLAGTLISFFTKKCFCVTTDAADVAEKYYGVPKSKLKVTTLGVDTDIFAPNEANRNRVRAELGVEKDEILCIYTGKFLKLRRTDLLADAIRKLRLKGLKIKALFIGEGEDGVYLQNTEGCITLPMQPHLTLPQYYQSADLAVWPFGESSSQLDAVATGLCLVMGDATTTYDLVESTSTYDEKTAYRPKIISRFCKTYDLDSLTEKLNELSDPSVRKPLIEKGRVEVIKKFSWDTIAQNRLEDYQS
ncbi:MAG: glycosyltransferase family 4 protein [Saprospiraceae bacterium]|nr:glycosyltransferase family 4 protein [Saprospiraceae bacterium]